MFGRWLFFIAVFLSFSQAALAKSDFCKGFERGFKAAAPYELTPICPLMPVKSSRPKSDYEFGFLKGSEKAWEDENLVASPTVGNGLKNDCNCAKRESLAAFNQVMNRKTVEQVRQEEELVKLRQQAEIEALNAQIRQSKGIGTSVRAKLTPTLAKQNAAQQAVVKEKIDKVGSLIAKLASGGSQETRQKNYDAVVAAQTDLLKTYSRFYSDWMEPKYYR